MAGSIIISKDVRVPLSTNQFDYLVERVGSQFGPLDMRVKEEVYFPMDEGGMMFISAESLNAQDFAAFSRAVMKARVAAQAEASFSTFESVWALLLERLRQDARFKL